MQRPILAGILLSLSLPAMAEWSLGLKTHRQIFESLSFITGVRFADPEIQATYNKHRERLPSRGELTEMNISSTKSLIAVADLYCRRWIANEAALAPSARRAHAPIAFDVSPRDISEENRLALVQNYARLFWQRPASTEETAALTKVMNETAKVLPPEPASTPKVLLPVCINTIVSLSFITN